MKFNVYAIIGINAKDQEEAAKAVSDVATVIAVHEATDDEPKEELADEAL